MNCGIRVERTTDLKLKMFRRDVIVSDSGIAAAGINGHFGLKETEANSDGWFRALSDDISFKTSFSCHLSP